jgi:hypothetical protein
MRRHLRDPYDEHTVDGIIAKVVRPEWRQALTAAPSEADCPTDPKTGS